MTKTNKPAANVVALKFPIEIDGTTVASITLRRPTVRDVAVLDERRDAGAGDLAATVALAAQLAGLSEDAIYALDIADFGAVSEVVTGFLPR